MAAGGRVRDGGAAELSSTFYSSSNASHSLSHVRDCAGMRSMRVPAPLGSRFRQAETFTSQIDVRWEGRDRQVPSHVNLISGSFWDFLPKRLKRGAYQCITPRQCQRPPDLLFPMFLPT